MTQEVRRVRLLAALSFEERCLASLAAWRNRDPRHLDSAIFFSYEDRATPDLEASVVREANWDQIKKHAAMADVQLSRYPIDPYSMGDLERHMAAASQDADEVIIDLSCFTKLHLMAAARSVLKFDPKISWSIIYSSPFSYGNLNAPTARGGWQDTLMLPLGDDPSLANQGMALGLMLAGMEADRTAIAMNDLEPASGMIILSRSQDRPDLQRLTYANNALLLAHLRGLRMPGPRQRDLFPYFPSGGWELEKIRLESVIADMTRCLKRIIKAADVIGAPIILFPFGPKTVVFLASLYLAKDYPTRSWAIYPIAKTHPIDYSDGVRSIEDFKGSTILHAMENTYCDAALSV